MVARLGDPPVHVATTGAYASEFFTPEGTLQQPLHPNQRVSLDRVLVERYGLAAEDVSGSGAGADKGCANLLPQSPLMSVSSQFAVGLRLRDRPSAGASGDCSSTLPSNAPLLACGAQDAQPTAQAGAAAPKPRSAALPPWCRPSSSQTSCCPC